MTETPLEELRDLARSYGVQVEYVATDGATRFSSAESLLAVLRALGVEISDEADAVRALRDRDHQIWRCRIEPVVVAWGGEPALAWVRFPKSFSGSSLFCRLTTETGEIREWSVPIDSLNKHIEPIAEGEKYAGAGIDLPGGLPSGYHRLRVEFPDGPSVEALVIAAPMTAYQGPEGLTKRPWGLFCPLHALHGASSWGAGDHSDLEALMDWTATLGGGLVATLPMLATAFDGPDPVVSPYSPTSRLFWNEFYLDLTRVPELADCETARALLDSPDAKREVDALRKGGLVEYGRQMVMKRTVLEHLADWFFEHEGERSPSYRAFVAEHPDVACYAEFQATGEQFGRNWREWPQERSVDPRAFRYHLYAQWQADEQLKTLAAKARDKGLAWYLDFPVGVDFNSYDVWSNRDAFATGASVGCPPDSVFTKGQNWGFPPLHPERQRDLGYTYLIASFRNHLRYANALRIDHVMGLHRLFWIPDGAEAKDGSFVSFPADEVYAILSVESHRHQAWLVGEDLGTVPPEVEGALKRHAVSGMYVAQYEVRPDADRPLRKVPEATVASVNTHDMPPFAAFWGGLDLDDRKDLGLLDSESLAIEHETRENQRRAVVQFLRAEGMLAAEVSDVGSVLRATWNWLAASPARVLLLNLEDLWLETESQNTPNTFRERPNWRRKLRRPFEEFTADPAFLEILKRVDELRSKPAREASPTR